MDTELTIDHREGDMIRTSFYAGLLLILPAIVLADEKADADAAARKSLAGVWRGFTVDGKGEKPDQGPVKLELTISEKTIKGIEFKGETPIDHGEGAFTLDLAADPQQLDGTKTNERGRKDTWLGIYRLEKDTLYWCVAKRERPEKFETVKGQFLMILKRDAK